MLNPLLIRNISLLLLSTGIWLHHSSQAQNSREWSTEASKLMEEGEIDKAFSILQEGIGIFPEDAFLRYQAGQCLGKMIERTDLNDVSNMGGKYDQAIKYLDQAIQRVQKTQPRMAKTQLNQ